MIRYLLSSLYIYWLKRSIRVCQYRREELHRIVDRAAAETIARESGQLTRPLIGAVLTSEDLW